MRVKLIIGGLLASTVFYLLSRNRVPLRRPHRPPQLSAWKRQPP